MSVCVDASLHKIIIRYANPVLVVDAVDECLSKVSVVEERLEWKIMASLGGSAPGLIDGILSPSLGALQQSASAYFSIDPCSLVVQGVPPCQRCHQTPCSAQTSMTNYDPFFHSFFRL